MYDKIKKKNIEFFTKTLNNANNEHSAVAQSERSHLKRFENIYKIGNWNNKSVLDVGCGIGSFYDFIIKRNKSINYTGFDINELMVKEAKKRNKNIENRFFVKDIIEEPISEKFNYVISVGPFNLKFANTYNMDFTKILLDKMFMVSIDGFAISMTSSLSKKKNNDTFYFDPLLITKYISSFTNNYILDHSFLPHDFVLFVYKKNLYDI